MREVLLAAVNVSEGRDPATIRALAAAVRGRPGVALVDVSSDPDHHRTVFTYLGEPDAVLEASLSLADAAFERIDMSRHEGEHPRLGGVDVVPFVPVGGTSVERAVEVAHRFGRAIGERGVPVYYYGEAARRPERRELPAVRAGGYEALSLRLSTPEGAPDEGPARFHPAAGAVVAGVRGPLLAFNVNLRTEDLSIADAIARAVRHRDGGFRYVRAIPVALRSRGMVQVSMNLVHPEETPPSRVLEAVRAEAERHGVAVAGTEIVGPVPLEVLVDAARHGLQAHGLKATQVVELGMLELLMAAEPAPT